MPEIRRTSDSSAERQLIWSRRYLRREKRGRTVRRVVFTLVLAVLLALGVYAATVDGGLSLPVFMPSSSSGSSVPFSSSTSSGAGSGSSLSAPASSTPASSSSTLTALNTCTVTFDARGGTMAETSFSVAYGACVTEPAPPERLGYTFGGWYADVARTLAWDFEKNAVLEDTTLYARWQLIEENPVLPQTGVSENISFWASVLAVSLALAAFLAYLCRRLEHRG